MNVFDFDKTIYKKDSSREFLLYCMIKNPALVRFLPKMAIAALKYKCGFITKTQMKTVMFSIIAYIQPIYPVVDAFWGKNRHGIANFYLQIKQDTDVIISASPIFLLEKLCDQLGVGKLIATENDPVTGALLSENCYGAQKVIRFREIYGDTPINAFYSDSLSDTPMAEISQKAFLVAGEKLFPWPSLDKD